MPVPLIATSSIRGGCPPLDDMPPDALSTASRIWMGVLRGYLLPALGLIRMRIVMLALAH